MSLRRHLPQMKLLYVEQGKTLAEVADTFDCSHESVRQLLLGAGVKLRPRTRPSQAPSAPEMTPSERALAVWEAGVAELLDCANQTHVRAIVTALGGKGLPYLALHGRAS